MLQPWRWPRPRAVNESRIYIDLVRDGARPPGQGDNGRVFVEELAETEARIAGQAPVAERIIDRVIPDWRTTVPKPKIGPCWAREREATHRAITVLHREAELREMLGDDAPAISRQPATPRAWDGARSMWSSRHYRQAEVEALKKVNAEAQNKTGRHNLSEADLFTQLLSAKPP